jgi:NAD(P)-dependent dehydrogenase (short-subunit alcohol dehydrogenase family)
MTRTTHGPVVLATGAGAEIGAATTGLLAARGREPTPTTHRDLAEAEPGAVEL